MNNKEFVTLKDYVLTLINERDEKVNIRLDAMDKALDLSKREMDRRLAELNNLREEVTEDRDDYVRKEVCGPVEKETAKWREDVNKRLTMIETRSVTWTAALVIFFIVITIVSNLLMRFLKI